MTEGQGRPAAPARPWQRMNGTGLKLLALGLMTADHIHQMFAARGGEKRPAGTAPRRFWKNGGTFCKKMLDISAPAQYYINCTCAGSSAG